MVRPSHGGDTIKIKTHAGCCFWQGDCPLFSNSSESSFLTVFNGARGVSLEVVFLDTERLSRVKQINLVDYLM